MIVVALALLAQVLLSVVGAVCVAWLLSPSSPSPLIARTWRRLIVVRMMPVPGLAGG